MGVNIVEAAQYLGFETVGVLYELVGRTYHYIGIGIGQHCVPCAPNGCGGGVELHGLGQNVGLGHFGQLLAHKGHIALVGGYVYVVGGDKTGKAVEGLLQQGAACAEEVDKLFGQLLLTCGPQAASNTTGQNDTVVLITCFHYQGLVG